MLQSIIEVNMDLDFNTAQPQYPRNEAYNKPVEDPISDFQAEMAKYSLFPDSIVPDGSIHRFHVGEGKKNKDGFYILKTKDYETFGGAFGSWKTGVTHKWTSLGEKSTVNWEQIRELAKESAEQIEKERKYKQSEAKIKAQEDWDTAVEITSELNHPYLNKKQVEAYGLRLLKGKILIPQRDLNGELWSLKTIDANGEKKNQYGGRKSGCCHIIEGVGDSVYVCEGYSTGASIFKATGGTVIIAGDTTGMTDLAQDIAKKYTEKQIVFCADNDQWTPGNPGVMAATNASFKVPNSRVIFPIFHDPHLLNNKPTDFNDLMIIEGIEAVTSQICDCDFTHKPFPPASDDKTILFGRVLKRPPPKEFILNVFGQGLYPKGACGVLTATGGVGKTLFLMRLAVTLSGGKAFGPITASKPYKTLFIAGEDDEAEITRRFWDMTNGHFPERLHAISVYGEIGALMTLNGGTPTLGEGYLWLEKTIQKHPGLDVIIIDPKSRFYGLDENNADHATQWVQCLESLGKRYGITIIFSHHTAKANSREITQEMGRGSAAIVDGCRWQAGMIRMPKDQAKQFGIDAKNHVLIDFPKMNYSAALSHPLIFRRGKNGILEYCEPHKEVFQEMTDSLLSIIKSHGCEFSRKEYIESRQAAFVSDEMKEEYESFNRKKTMGGLIDNLIQNGKLQSKTVPTGGNPKVILYAV